MRKKARLFNKNFKLILQKALLINNKAKNTKFNFLNSSSIQRTFVLFTIFCSITLKVFAVEDYKVKTVVIDAGHGGKDPGAIGFTNSYEKDITLAVSLKLGAMIKENYPNIKVVYTRDKDVFVELQERAAIANKVNADLFISIHCNANNDRTAYGTETYCLGLHRSEANLEVAKRENSVILLEDDYVEKYDGFDPNASEAHIIFSLFQNAFLNQSISLASKVDNHLTVTSGRRSRGVKQAGFLVLYKTTMPGVLIELGFISNKNEEAFLKSDDGQTKIAKGLLNSFVNYKKEAEGNKATIEKQTITKEEEPKEPIENPKNITNNSKLDTLKSKTNDDIVVKTDSQKTKAPIQNIPKSTDIKVEKPIEKKPEIIKPTYVFKVQFAASKVKLPADEARLKKVLEYEIEKADNGYLRYLSGKFINLKNAEAMLQTLKNIGFTDAFIAPYENGVKRITLKEYLAANP